MHLIIFISVFLIILGVIEKHRHTKRLQNIPIRIQVNGTRGKSTLVRMIVDLFNSAGWKVAGKITGETPKYFISGKGWNIWKRRGVPRIGELIRFLKFVSPHNPKVLIVENMALQPEFQYMFEKKLSKSTHQIVTNIRLDHQEVMGKHKTEIAQTLAASVPKSGNIIVEADSAPLIGQFIKKKRLLTVIKNDYQAVKYDRFLFNQKVIEYLGEIFKFDPFLVQKVVSTNQIELQVKELIHQYIFQNKTKHFVNLFKCNDVESTQMMIDKLMELKLIRPKFSIILACRGDRPLRTMAFLRWLVNQQEFWSKLVICGIVPKIPILRMIKPHKIDKEKIYLTSKINSETTLGKYLKNSDVIIGMGNFVNSGEKILNYIEELKHGS